MFPWFFLWFLSVSQPQKMMYHLVAVNKSCYFSLGKGSLNPTCFLEFTSKLSQRHSQEMLAVVFNSCVESSPIICNLLGQKMLFHIQKYPMNSWSKVFINKEGAGTKPSPPSLPAQLWCERRTHSPHCIIQQHQHIRKWQLLNSIFLFMPTKSFVKGHFCPSCI